tara:strand:+ start:93 stop:377 length:285 start_codon:yes stop_codon:yes gene_type:complete
LPITSASGKSDYKTDPGINGWDLWLVEIDSSGNKLWDKTYGGMTHDIAEGLLSDSKGNLLVLSRSNSSNGVDVTEVKQGLYDFWLLKLDPYGNK